MPTALHDSFKYFHGGVERILNQGPIWSASFAAGTTRDNVIIAHRVCRETAAQMVAAQAISGMEAYVREQFLQPALDFSIYAGGIADSANAVSDWVEANFPTLGSVVQTAMTTIGLPAQSQTDLLTELGSNTQYLLISAPSGGNVTATSIPGTALSPLVALLNALVAAATLP